MGSLVCCITDVRGLVFGIPFPTCSSWVGALAFGSFTLTPPGLGASAGRDRPEPLGAEHLHLRHRGGRRADPPAHREGFRRSFWEEGIVFGAFCFDVRT